MGNVVEIDWDAKLAQAEQKYINIGFEIVELKGELIKKRKYCVEVADNLQDNPDILSFLEVFRSKQ